MTTSAHPMMQTQHADLLIRRMRFLDLDQVMEIEAVSFGRFYWSKDSFMSELKNQVGRYYSLIYKPENKVIGYTGYWLILDEAHITTVAVNPEFRGQSLGELLVVKALDRTMTQSVKWVTLEVRTGNLTAQQLYYKYGFQTMGLRPKYYQDTFEDALIMTCGNIQLPEFRKLFGDNKTILRNKLGGQLPEGVE